MWKGIHQLGEGKGRWMAYLLLFPHELYNVYSKNISQSPKLYFCWKCANPKSGQLQPCVWGYMPWVLWQRSSTVCTRKSESQLHFGLYQKNCGQQIKEVNFLLSSALMRCNYIQVQGPQHKKDTDLSGQVQRRPWEERLSCEDNSLCWTAQGEEGSYTPSHASSLLLITAVWSVEEIILHFRVVYTHFCMTHR